MTRVQKIIQSIDPTHDPRWIEGFMRVHHGTLDHLSREQIEEGIRIFKLNYKTDPNPYFYEHIAKSFGL